MIVPFYSNLTCAFSAQFRYVPFTLRFACHWAELNQAFSLYITVFSGFGHVGR